MPETLNPGASSEPSAESPAAPAPAAPAANANLEPARRHLLFLMLWWAVIVVYFVALTSPISRFSKDWVTWDMLYDARYVVLAAGTLGAISAERHKLLWLFISAAGALVFLLLSLVLLGSVRSALG